MNVIHYIGFDVHKKTISYCVKTVDGRIVEEGTLQAQRTVPVSYTHLYSRLPKTSRAMVTETQQGNSCSRGAKECSLERVESRFCQRRLASCLP